MPLAAERTLIGMSGRVRTDREFAHAIMAQQHNVPPGATLTAVLIGAARYRSSRTRAPLSLAFVSSGDN